MRTFDPVRLGSLEAAVWVAYYQRRWVTFLRSAIGLVRTGFGMPWPGTVHGAWLVLRANQLWAPYPDNDPDGARAAMRHFYALVAAAHQETFDIDEAARREVEWWRVHRYLQREAPGGPVEPLVDAVAALYSHLYGVSAGTVREAARHRAEAMVISDRWVAAGRVPDAPDLTAERDELIRGYVLLRAAVGPPART
jgi:hypothetical protein